MARTSAGLLVYRRRQSGLQALLVHPGGPFWAARDRGAWSLPKGEVGAGEEPLLAAQREVREETGFAVSGEFRALTPLRQRGGKMIQAWAVEADWDPASLRSNTFTTEWPPRSGTVRHFPEIDRAAWFPIDEALQRIVPGQAGFLRELVARVGDVPFSG